MTYPNDRQSGRWRSLKTGMAAIGLTVLAACAKTVAPPPPPPPPPPIQIIAPPKPLPPVGAYYGMSIPQKLPMGTRQTVNSFITPMQATWNVRSAFNVAALNCLAPRHAPLLENYQTFLTRFDRQLATANKAITREFAAQYGRDGRSAEDAYLTKVYNYFALPPVQEAFCDTALALSGEAVIVEPGDLDTFTARALPVIEADFERFFSAYEQFELNLAAWEAKYGTNVALDPYALQQAIAATPPVVAMPQPLPTEGPILR